MAATNMSLAFGTLLIECFNLADGFKNNRPEFLKSPSWMFARLLFGASIFNVVSGVLTVTQSTAVQASQTDLCTSLSIALTEAYLLSNLFILLFLCERARLVNTMHTPFFSRMHGLAVKLMFWSCVGGILLFCVLVGVFFGGYITRGEGVCVIFESAVWISAFFASADFATCLSLLLLFVVPLLNSAREISDANAYASHELFVVARRNAILATFAMTLTFATVVLFSVGESLMVQDPEKWAFLEAASQAAAQLDVIVNAVVCRILTSAWMPRRMRNALHAYNKKTAHSTVHSDRQGHASRSAVAAASSGTQPIA